MVYNACEEILLTTGGGDLNLYGSLKELDLFVIKGRDTVLSSLLKKEAAMV